MEVDILILNVVLGIALLAIAQVHVLPTREPDSKIYHRANTEVRYEDLMVASRKGIVERVE